MIGDRFVKDGKTYEVTSENSWGMGYRLVKDEEIVPEEVFEVTPEEIPEEEPIVEPVKKTRRRTRK